MREPIQGSTSKASGLHIDFSRPDWPKRIAFLLVWVLLIFGDKLAVAAGDYLPEQFKELAPALGSPRVLWLLALAVIVLASRGRPLAILVQTAYFLLFIPLALAFIIYKAANLVVRFPRITLRFLTSLRLHMLLWPLVTLSVLGVLAGWVPQLEIAYLVIILFAVATTIALAFLLAFSPGTLHRNLGKLAISMWKVSKRDIEQKIQSGELVRDSSKKASKIREIENLRDQGEKLIAYFAKTSDPATAVKVFVISLAVLMTILAFLFAVAFMAVAEISSESFLTSNSVRFTDLILYSLSNMLGAEPLGPTPLSTLAKVVAAFQLICSAAVVITLLLVLTTISPERYRKELEAITAEIHRAQKEVQDTLTSLGEENKS